MPPGEKRTGLLAAASEQSLYNAEAEIRGGFKIIPDSGIRQTGPLPEVPRAFENLTLDRSGSNLQDAEDPLPPAPQESTS